MHKLRLIIGILILGLLPGGCAQYENKRGILDHWQGGGGTAFVPGQTTRRDVLDTLGPPSQLIALGDETVLYYLYEYSEGAGLVLLVYNQFKVDTRYDRAIFFFDENDLLTDHSSHFSVRDSQ